MYAVFYDDVEGRQGFECEEEDLFFKLRELGFVDYEGDQVKFLENEMNYDNLEIYELTPQSLIKRKVAEENCRYHDIEIPY